jgi:hypothetical protein
VTGLCLGEICTVGFIGSQEGEISFLGLLFDEAKLLEKAFVFLSTDLRFQEGRAMVWCI